MSRSPQAPSDSAHTGSPTTSDSPTALRSPSQADRSVSSNAFEGMWRSSRADGSHGEYVVHCSQYREALLGVGEHEGEPFVDIALRASGDAMKPGEELAFAALRIRPTSRTCALVRQTLRPVLGEDCRITLVERGADGRGDCTWVRSAVDLSLGVRALALLEPLLVPTVAPTTSGDTARQQPIPSCVAPQELRLPIALHPQRLYDAAIEPGLLGDRASAIPQLPDDAQCFVYLRAAPGDSGVPRDPWTEVGFGFPVQWVENDRTITTVRMFQLSAPVLRDTSTDTTRGKKCNKKTPRVWKLAVTEAYTAAPPSSPLPAPLAVTDAADLTTWVSPLARLLCRRTVHCAAQAGAVPWAQTELQALTSLDDQTEAVSGGLKEDDYSPLHYAARLGHTAMIRYLLEHGASIDAKRHSQKSTAVHYAVVYHQVDALRLLLDHAYQTHKLRVVDKRVLDDLKEGTKAAWTSAELKSLGLSRFRSR